MLNGGDGGVVMNQSLRAYKLPIYCVIIGAAVLLCWHFRWLEDDAFITFRYAHNLAKGLGPVWNPGYAVEGYTNFLWMLILSGAESLGLDMATSSQILGCFFFAGSLFAVISLARTLCLSDLWTVLVLLLVSANFSFFMYATGGLETSLMTALSLAALAVSTRALEENKISALSAFALSVILALAVMTRPDGVIVSLVALAGVVLVCWNKQDRWWILAVLTLPGMVLVVPWLAWKIPFYGDLLPNTFYAKSAGKTYLTYIRGFLYDLWPFISFFWLIGLGLLIVKSTGLKKTLSNWSRSARLLIVFLLLWYTYMIWVGGGVMEYRLLISTIPIVILLMISWAARIWEGPLKAWPLVLILALGQFFHIFVYPEVVIPRGFNSIPNLSRMVQSENPGNWTGLGKKLFDDLGDKSSVMIGVTVAGAIPYYSKLLTVDMLGLNDIWVARHGFDRKNCVAACQAHAKLATIAYLKRRGVNLVFGQPQIFHEPAKMPDAEVVLRRLFYGEAIDFEHIPEEAQMVSIPLGSGFVNIALYLSRNDEVERLIESGKWIARPIQPL